MKLSELIALLQDRLEKWGDVKTGIYVDYDLVAPLKSENVTVSWVDKKLAIVIDSNPINIG